VRGVDVSNIYKPPSREVDALRTVVGRLRDHGYEV
jgi:hypothetical protein